MAKITFKIEYYKPEQFQFSHYNDVDLTFESSHNDMTRDQLDEMYKSFLVALGYPVSDLEDEE